MLTSQPVSEYDTGMDSHAGLLARALVALRERANLGPVEVAEKVGVRRETVSRWENGSTGIEMRNLFALLDLYGATLADLGDATRATSNAPGRSRFHFIAEQTGREQDLRIAELEAKVRRLQLDVDDLVSSRGEGGT